MVANGKTIKYSYTASGQKIAATFGTLPKYDYIAGNVWANDTLEFVPTAEGRYTKANKYEYYLKDHLGNLIISCGCDRKGLKTLQENHYDPWGVELTGLGITPSSNANRFNYNGKETQIGTGYLDYGARMYDALVPHFTTADPLSELDFNQTPYMYVSGNPISRIDLFGMTDSDAIAPPLCVVFFEHCVLKIRSGL
jgi:RHS repeat-associated protein